MSPFSAKDLRALAVVTDQVPVSLDSLSWYVWFVFCCVDF